MDKKELKEKRQMFVREMAEMCDKYRDLFGYDWSYSCGSEDKFHTNVVEHAEGAFGEFANTFPFESEDVDEAIAWARGYSAGLDLAMRSMMGVPIRLAKIYDKEYYEKYKDKE